MPTPSQSPFIQRAYKQQTNLFLSPVIQELIREHNKKMRFPKRELEEEKDKEGSGDG